MNAATPLEPAQGWARPTAVRLPPPPVRERGVLFRTIAAIARLCGRAELPHVFPVIHLNPRLFWAWLWFASRLMPWGRLPAATREKAILRVAWNCRSRYEWAQHVDIALRAGVSDAQIVAVTRPASDIADTGDRLLMQACDQLCHGKLIDDPTWQALGKRYCRRDLIELVMLVGHYEMVAGVLINAGIEAEANVERTLEALHRRLATTGA